MLQSQGHDKNFQFALARIGGREQENHAWGGGEGARKQWLDLGREHENQWLELPNLNHAAEGLSAYTPGAA